MCVLCKYVLGFPCQYQAMLDKDIFIYIIKANTSKKLQLHLSKVLTKLLGVTNINVYECCEVINNFVTLNQTTASDCTLCVLYMSIILELNIYSII